MKTIDIKKTIFICMTLSFVFLFAPLSSGAADVNPADAPRISIDELKQLYDSGTDMIILDCQSTAGYEDGHIKGAVLFTMEPTWLSRWRKKGGLATFLGPDKDRFIVFY